MKIDPYTPARRDRPDDRQSSQLRHDSHSRVPSSMTQTCNLPFVTGTGEGNSMTASTTLQTGPSAQTDPPQLFGLLQSFILNNPTIQPMYLWSKTLHSDNLGSSHYNHP